MQSACATMPPDRRNSPCYDPVASIEAKEASSCQFLVAFNPSSSFLEACFMPGEAFAYRIRPVRSLSRAGGSRLDNGHHARGAAFSCAVPTPPCVSKRHDMSLLVVRTRAAGQLCRRLGQCDVRAQWLTGRLMHGAKLARRRPVRRGTRHPAAVGVHNSWVSRRCARAAREWWESAARSVQCRHR